MQPSGRYTVSISTGSAGLWKSMTWTSKMSTAEPGILSPGRGGAAARSQLAEHGAGKKNLSLQPSDAAGPLTCSVLAVSQVGGDDHPPPLPHADPLQALVHAGDDVALPDVGVVGVISGVAARREASRAPSTWPCSHPTSLHLVTTFFFPNPFPSSLPPSPPNSPGIFQLLLAGWERTRGAWGHLPVGLFPRPPIPGVEERPVHQRAVVVVTHKVPGHSPALAGLRHLQVLQEDPILGVVEVHQQHAEHQRGLRWDHGPWRGGARLSLDGGPVPRAGAVG